MTNKDLKSRVSKVLVHYGYIPLLKILQKYIVEENFEKCHVIREAMCDYFNQLISYNGELKEMYDKVLNDPIDKLIEQEDKWFADNLPIAYRNRDIYFMDALKMLEGEQ